MKGWAAFIVIGALVWMAFIHFLGCATPNAGASCPTSNASYCLDGGVNRVCVGNALVDYQCNGPRHCQVASDRTVTCDQTAGATPGTPCLVQQYAGQAECSVDGLSELACLSGTWTQLACPQGQKCTAGDGGVGCH